MSHSATESSVSDPAWWAAASSVGTKYINVLIPNVTCAVVTPRSAFIASLDGAGRGNFLEYAHSPTMAVEVPVA